MNLKLCAGVAGTVVLAASSAMAQSSVPVGSYVQVNLGAGVAGQTEVSVSSPTGSGSQDADVDAGFFGSVAVGRNFDNNVAVEAELLYGKNDIDTADIDRVLGFNLDASVKTTAVMANVYYNVGGLGPINARIGAGVGYGQSEYELLGESDKGDGVMWQVLVGGAYPINDKVSLDVGYRYLRAPEYELSDAGTKVSAETGAHVVTLGARFGF
ncbi:outer membrane beta-barrel protein [Phenylobacterium sp.]|uniref:outer membrane protein n=1 Tax=Phenylobacterium sp. TaxID=1871053 RepID=UPI0028989D50|nr:outer membrane beta-barrel protein [Phenylobacterium sp.]